MAWFYLLLAGLFEIGWPVGFKIAQDDSNKIKGTIIAIVCMGCSGILLYIAQKTIPMGTAYAAWTAIGTAGTFLVGILVYHDHGGLMHYLGITMIIFGVALLKLAS